MIVRNWMKPDPVTVTSDTLVSKAKRILVEQNLRALPVVDNGRLRGIVTRVNCLRASEFVARTEDPYEFSYFVNRLKVKDLMVRNPSTVNVTDTMEICLRRGQAEGISQFPVMENGKVVGLVSASEVFFMAAQMLGVARQWSGVTVGPVRVERGTLRKIGTAVEEAGGVLESIFTIGPNDDDGCAKVVLRFTGAAAEDVAANIKAQGFRIISTCPWQPHDKATPLRDEESAGALHAQARG